MLINFSTLQRIIMQFSVAATSGKNQCAKTTGIFCICFTCLEKGLRDHPLSALNLPLEVPLKFIGWRKAMSQFLMTCE